MNFSKEGLYAEILKYIYAHNFKDLKVFSKQYLHSVAVPSYTDNSHNEPYSIISIDFNDMAKINEKGMKQGNKILHGSIECMQSVMPEGSFCIRVGGDEFLFVLPNVEKKDALNYESAMHSSLEKNSKKLNSATVTSYCVHSSESDCLYDMMEIADSAINVIKTNAKSKDSVDNWDILQDKITDNFSTFFKNLRFHDFPMKIDHLKNILTRVITSYNTEYKIPYPKKSKQSNPHEFQDIASLRKLNSLLTSSSSPFSLLDKINELDINMYENLLDGLVREPITKQFNRSYLINQLLENENRTFKAMQISPALVKASNTINNSHSATDKQIEELVNKVHSYFDKIIPLNTDAFSIMPNNYLISFDGGDMLLALDSKTKLDEKSINGFFAAQDVESFSHNNLLKLVSSGKFEKLNRKNLDKFLNRQSGLCNKNKIPIIENFLNDDLISDLLSITLQDTMDFYNKVVHDSNNIVSQTRFFNLVSKTVLDLYSSLNVVHDNTTLPKKTSSFDKLRAKIVSILKKEKNYDSSKNTVNNPISNNTHKKFIASVPKTKINHIKANEQAQKHTSKNTEKTIE